MEINANFLERAAAHYDQLPWTPSPIAGVDRKMLDRLGGEVARATSIVRYAPNSHFAHHVHTGGEEFFVLDGVFQDEHGDFPAGSYVRNPPNSKHTPGSKLGCTIFVKLWQFDPEDRTHVRVDTTKATFAPTSDHPGVEVMTLFKDQAEHVSLERWPANQRVTLNAEQGGLELLVLDGTFSVDREIFAKQDWLRLPINTQYLVATGSDGAKVWIKRGHLADDPRPPAI